MSSTKVLKPAGVIILVIITIMNKTIGQIPSDSNSQQCSDKVPKFCSCNGEEITCDCGYDTAELGPAFGEKTHITMKNCQRLTLQPQSFRKSGSLQILLQNITDLHFMKGSFEMDAFTDARINLTIINVTSKELPSNTFTLREHSTSPLGATNYSKATKAKLIFQIANCVIHKISTGAFGKFIIQKFFIANSTLEQIAKMAVDNHVTNKFQISNTTIGEIQKYAITIQNSSVNESLYFAYNKFKGAVPLFLVGNIKGDVYIRNNTFPKMEQSPWNLRVQGDVTLRSNMFNNIPKHGLFFRIKNRINIVNNDIKYLQGGAFQWIKPEGNKALLFLDGNVFHKHDPMSLVLNESFTVDSVVIKHNLFQQKCFCNITDDLSAALGLKTRTVERIKRTTTIPSAASDYQSFTEPVPPSRAPSAWAIVQPDPRTYQETEIHILFDKAQEMDAYDRNSLPILEDNEYQNNTDQNKSNVNTKEGSILEMKTTGNTRQSCPVLPISMSNS
ncbi:uncharacterized protein [Cherax quadricarinatus]|uniref:uncharacterized protein isoform X2 n=1 Tax=Cherax quadricarinatus TaxID=27406 RepID=UPI002379CC07|nr:uncharacterized protein LOC128697543 isoform X2 [Cherax quadricarinatus]